MGQSDNRCPQLRRILKSGSWSKVGGWPFSARCGSVLLSMLVVNDRLLGGDPMDFPILDLMDREVCCRKLFDLLPPEGFACPRCGPREGLNVHRRHADS